MLRQKKMSENFAYDTYYSYSEHVKHVLYQFLLTLNRKMLRDGKGKPRIKHSSDTNLALHYVVLLLKTKNNKKCFKPFLQFLKGF